MIGKEVELTQVPERSSPSGGSGRGDSAYGRPDHAANCRCSYAQR